MANPEHLAMLQQGIEAWNEWRETQDIPPGTKQFDLSGADLRDLALTDDQGGHALLLGMNMNMDGVNLSGVNLRGMNFFGTRLNHADLSGADLGGAMLTATQMRGSNLVATSLQGAILLWTDLRDASFISCDLSDATLQQANMSNVTLYDTVFARTIFRDVKGLTEIQHAGPCRVELHSLQLPLDGSALRFLRGCGIPDQWIEYRMNMAQGVQYHSCFLSYSNADELFARRLRADLQDQGVRCWFAPEDLKIGQKIREGIDEAVSVQDKLLLILSEHSMASDWVETEVEIALEKERKQEREVLFPVRLDESVMYTDQAWAKHLRLKRHIGDFTQWIDPLAYQEALNKLLRDLKKSEEPGYDPKGLVTHYTSRLSPLSRMFMNLSMGDDNTEQTGSEA